MNSGITREGSITPFLLNGDPSLFGQNAVISYLNKNKMESEDVSLSAQACILGLQYSDLTLRTYTRSNSFTNFQSNVPDSNTTRINLPPYLPNYIQNEGYFTLLDRKGMSVSSAGGNLTLINLESKSIYRANNFPFPSGYKNWLYAPMAGDTILFQRDQASKAVILDRFTLRVLATIQIISYSTNTKVLSFNGGTWLIINNSFYQYDPSNLVLNFIVDLSPFLSNTNIVFDDLKDIDISPDQFILVQQPGTNNGMYPNAINTYFRWIFSPISLGTFSSQVEFNLMSGISSFGATPKQEKVKRIAGTSSYIVSSLPYNRMMPINFNKTSTDSRIHYWIKYSLLKSVVLESDIFIPGTEIGYQQIQDSLYLFTISSFDNSIVVSTIDPVSMQIRYVNSYPDPIAFLGIAPPSEADDTWSYDITLALNGNLLFVLNKTNALVYTSPTVGWVSLGNLDITKYMSMDPNTGAVYRIERAQPTPILSPGKV